MQTWSRILETDLGRAARTAYLENPARTYHNWDHVLRLYWHAEHTFALEYDPDLDKAILAHDVIYDARPDKELRSAAWLSAQSGQDESVANGHIAKTICHVPTDDNRMALLDLADFLHPELCRTNHDKISQEARTLYDVSEAEFLAGNKVFMTALYDRIAANLGNVSEQDAAWFRDILKGIQLAIDLVDQKAGQT